MVPRPKVGLALGGGAARGLAHVGVLRAFVRDALPIQLIAGTSIGAIMGGAFAACADIEWLEGRVREILGSEDFRRNRLRFLRESRAERGGLLLSVSNLLRRGLFFGVSNVRPSFLSAEEFARSLGSILPETPIESLPTPFGAVALDIETAEEVLIRRGSLRHAASASSAIPGILPPVRFGGRLLVDGGWVDKLPVLPAFAMGAELVIAVDIAADVESARNYRRGVDIMVRANSIKDAALTALQSSMADVVIRPDVGSVHWADFGAYEQCIRAGEEAATAALPRIRELLGRERLQSLIRPARGRRMATMLMRFRDTRLVVV